MLKCNNNLVSVDFTGSYNLYSVNLRYNSINSLVLPDSTYGDPWYCSYYGDCYMNELSLYGNTSPLTLNFPPAFEVYYLNLEYVPIDSLNVSTLDELVYLYLDHTNITSLDLSTNNKISTVEARNCDSLVNVDMRNKINLGRARFG